MKVHRPISEVIPIAKELCNALMPHCERLAVAGSLRRRSDTVGDIELLLIAKPYDVGLFRSGVADVLEPLEKLVGDLGPKCRYTKRVFRGIQVDVFFAKPKNWGYLYAIRTGPAEYSKALAERWVKKGYHGVDGFLMKGRNVIAVPEEERLYELLGLPYVSPWLRGNSNSNSN